MDSAVLTGLGLAPSAGLNAYIPLLVLALADRFSDRIMLERPYDFLSSNIGLAILLVLLTVEIVADKIPGVDHGNDLVQSAIRPASGAIAMMAATHAENAMNPVLAMIIGLLLAGGIHGIKAVMRPAITVSTGGFGNPIVSFIEDGFAAITSVVAILLPALAVALVAGFSLLLWWLYGRIRRLTAFTAGSTDTQSLRR